MLIKGFAAVAGRKRLFLVGVVLLAATMGTLAERSSMDLWLGLFALTLGLVLLMVVLSYVAAVRYHPAVLFVRPETRAFATAVNLAPVFSAASFVMLSGGMLGDKVGDVVKGEELWVLDAVLAGFWVLVAVFHLYLAWGSFGVRLRPEGIHDRQPLGSLFVPWEALTPGYSAVPLKRYQLALSYQRPDLVRQRGVRPGGLLATSTDATYLARAIDQYVTSPEHRSAIGTEAELRRLTASLAG